MSSREILEAQEGIRLRNQAIVEAQAAQARSVGGARVDLSEVRYLSGWIIGRIGAIAAVMDAEPGADPKAQELVLNVRRAGQLLAQLSGLPQQAVLTDPDWRRGADAGAG